MKETASDRLRPLHDRAKGGDLKAGKELIKVCRTGMLSPYWEGKHKPTRKTVETHLHRREGRGSGRMMR